MRKTIICLTVFLLSVVSSSAVAAPIIDSYLNPNLTDADKLHDQGAWIINYWDDLNSNGLWEVGEPLADAMDPTWINGQSDDDKSCWIASAANMLASDGYGGGDAQSIYWNMVNHFGWQDGGWQHVAIDWYLTTFPDPKLNSTVVYYVISERADQLPDAQPWPTDPFDFAANSLANGSEIGLGIFDGCPHAITFQGYDWNLLEIMVTDSDQDVGGTDLDTWIFNTTGTTGWHINDICIIGVDVEYYALLDTQVIPAPGAILLGSIGVGCVSWLRRRKKI